MSIIIGFKRDGKIWMAGDSRVTQGSHVNVLSDSTSKIWQEPGIIIGGVGTLHELQLMRFGGLIDYKDVIADEVDAAYIYWLYTKYADLFCKRYGVNLDANTGYPQVLSSTFMFAVNGHLYTLDSWGSVLEHENFEAIGCADDLVRGYLAGYLASHKDVEDVPQLLIDAIKMAATMDSGIDTNAVIYVQEFEDYDENPENSDEGN